jgi:hypothetical protein
LSLNHVGNIQAYIKEFIGIRLEIKYMLEEDTIFHFMNSLYPWAHSDLQCYNVQTLATTITAVDKLLDFRGEPKIGPRNIEDAQGENKEKGKGKSKDKDIQG